MKDGVKTMNNYLEELLFQRCLEARIECQKSDNARTRARFIALFELIIDAGYEEAYIEWICKRVSS